jgi:hypothetical protein
MSLDIPSHVLGTASSRSHPHVPSPSSSTSSTSSSVFSDTESQASLSSSSTAYSAPSSWDSEEWSSRVQSAPQRIAAEHFASISRINTFPQYEPPACREVISDRVLPPLRTDFALPAVQRQHPRRSSTTINQRPPPQLVRQVERKVNFVDCLVGQYFFHLFLLFCKR